MNKILLEAQDSLLSAINSVWDADEFMDDVYVLQSPLGVFCQKVFKVDPVILSWLTFFSARSTLPCWILSCKSKEPFWAVEQIKNFLLDRVSAQALIPFLAPIPTEVQDCRFSDTASTADAIAFAAKYCIRQNLLDAIYSLSSAYIAFDHVFTEDRFRFWLLETAFPAAIEKRELTKEEIHRMSASQKYLAEKI